MTEGGHRATDTIEGHPAVARVRDALESHGVAAAVTVLDGSARTAAEAASQLGVAVGQIANSLVFRTGPAADPEPLLVLTSGRHRVDTALADYDVIWAAAGHPHAVFPTTYDELVRITGGTPAAVAGDAGC